LPPTRRPTSSCSPPIRLPATASASSAVSASASSASPPALSSPSPHTPDAFLICPQMICCGVYRRRDLSWCQKHQTNSSSPRRRRSRRRLQRLIRFGLMQPSNGFTSSVAALETDQVRNDMLFRLVTYGKGQPRDRSATLHFIGTSS